MVVVVNGLLSNGRLPHAYYYKWPALSRGRPIRVGVRLVGAFVWGSGSWEPPTRVAGRTDLAWGIAPRIAGWQSEHTPPPG